MPGRRFIPILSIGIGLAIVPADLAGQIRPLTPLDPCTALCGRRLVVEVGGSVLAGQRASLAGTEGRLVELGQLLVLWRLDRVAFEAAGTLWRRLEERRRFADPIGGVAETGGPRSDVGDFRLGTIVTLVRSDAAGAVLRFGTRLPTTDDGVGLERDRTDFFALVGGEYRRGALAAAAESGLGIHGTRGSSFDQVDVWLYSATLEYQQGALVPGITLVGQADGMRGPQVRGNEDLREVRAGVRIGRRRWARVMVALGLADFSPRVGLAISAGAAF